MYVVRQQSFQLNKNMDCATGMRSSAKGQWTTVIKGEEHTTTLSYIDTRWTNIR